MTDLGNRSLTDQPTDHPPIGTDPSGHRSHGRTDGLTKKISPSESASPNASPAGGHNEIHSSAPQTTVLARLTASLQADMAEEHATDVRPVMPVVARTLSDDDARLREPLDLDEVREIESFTWEFQDAAGNVTIAADDLIRLCRQTLQLDRELAADRKAIGVLGAAVGKVGDLHHETGAGWCDACDREWPCATAVAIGAGQ